MLRRCLPIVVIALACMPLAGCRQGVDLDAVRAFATAAEASDRSFAYVAGDFYDSCLRQQSWSDLYVGGRAKLSDPCGSSRVAAQQWAGLNDIVLDYYRALGAIAGSADDGRTDYGLPALGKSLDGLGNPLGLGNVTASSLATDVLHDIFDARRRAGIANGALAAAPHVTALTAVLRTIATDKYDFALGNESIALERFFAPIPPASKPLGHGPATKDPAFAQNLLVVSTKNIEKYSLDQLRLRLRDERAKIDARHAAIASYTKALDDLDASNAALLQTVRERSPAAFVTVARTYFGRYGGALRNIDKAYHNGGSSEE